MFYTSERKRDLCFVTFQIIWRNFWRGILAYRCQPNLTCLASTISPMTSCRIRAVERTKTLPNDLDGRDQAQRNYRLGDFPATQFLFAAARAVSALKAFGKIIKSLFILRYINEVELRRAIER